MEDFGRLGFAHQRQVAHGRILESLVEGGRFFGREGGRWVVVVVVVVAVAVAVVLCFKQNNEGLLAWFSRSYFQTWHILIFRLERL